MNHDGIIAISKTFLKPEDPDSTLRQGGFNFYHVNRIGVGSRSIGVYLRESFKVKTLSHSDTTYDNTPENLIF